LALESLDGKRLLIVGGGVAGYQVATRMRNLAAGLEVVMCSSEGEPPVSSCGMPWGICDVYPLEKVILKNADWFTDNGIDLRLNTTVDSVDLKRKEAAVRGPEGEIVERFDFLVLATGRTPFVPPTPGTDLPGVFTLSSYSDSVGIKSALKTAKNVTLVGAGPIGLEFAGILASRGYNVSVVKSRPSVLPNALDPDMAQLVQQHISPMFKRMVIGSKKETIEGKGHVESVRIPGDEWSADVVVLSTGTRPNVALGESAGLDIGQSGGLATDDELHCKMGGKPLLNVFTVGDCAEVRDGITGKPRLAQLASTSLLESRIVCANLCGDNLKLPGIISPQVTALPGLNTGSVGLTSARAESEGFDFVECSGQSKSRSGYFPGAGTFTAKLLFEESRLIGAQLVSPDGIHGTLDMLCQAILHRMGAEELLYMERSYSPPLAMLEDAVAKAAANKL